MSISNYKRIQGAKDSSVTKLQIELKDELETQILLSNDLGYMKAQEEERLQGNIEEVERMLKALIKSLENKHSTP